MSGTFTPKVLGEGQLAATKGTLYTTPASTSTYVRFVRVHNTAATSETIIIYHKAGATSRIIGRAVLAQHESALIDTPFHLETGDLIEGATSNATSVDYVITGVEET